MKVYDLEHHFYEKEVIEFLKNRKDYPYCTKEGNIYYREKALLPMSAQGNNSEHKAIDELVDVDDIRLSIMDKADYPYEDVKGSVDFIKNLPISKEYKEKILYKNAEKYILNIK